MALIKCPECGKEISSQASVCIHCGFPLKTQNTICTIDGTQFDFSESLSMIEENERTNALSKDELIRKIQYSLPIVSLGVMEYYNLIAGIVETKTIPQSFNHVSPLSQLTCPKCGSTAVTTGQRGWKWTTGFLGSGKTVNRCGKCGHTWEPK